MRDDALEYDLSTLVLADERWFEYCWAPRQTPASSPASTSARTVPRRCGAWPHRPDRDRRLHAKMEPESFDVISSTPYCGDRQGLCPTAGPARDGCSCWPLIWRSRDRRHDLAHPANPRLPRCGSASMGTGARNNWCAVTPESGRDTFCRDSSGSVAPGSSRGRHLLHRLSGCRPAVRRRARWADGPRGPRVPLHRRYPRSTEFFGPISYYGVDDVFARHVGTWWIGPSSARARAGEKHTFDWEFFPGTTTRPTE